MKYRFYLHRLSTISLVSIFLVILAGSIVRMTGSGMGCPDWPKCFGYYVPPTSVETLTWTPGREFAKGNIIIRDEKLLVAVSDFNSGAEFQPTNWAPYTKHDYAIFNPMHTWVEFINRLIGAFTGIPVLILFLFSLSQIKRDLWITITAFLGLVLLAFEAWLGKVVVDGNLVPHQITYHMLGAVLLVAIYSFLTIRLSSNGLSFRAVRDKKIVRLGIISLILIFIQIILGTSVREEVDTIGKSNLLSSPDWIESLTVIFKIHRSFSLLILGIAGWFALKLIQTRTISLWPRILLILIVLEILAGMGLAYLDLPGILQPVHLLFAVADFALVWSLLIIYFKKTLPSGPTLAT